MKIDLALTKQFTIEHKDDTSGIDGRRSVLGHLLDVYPVGRNGRKVWIHRDQLTEAERGVISSVIRDLGATAEAEAEALKRRLRPHVVK